MSWLMVFFVFSVSLGAPPQVVQTQILADLPFATEADCKAQAAQRQAQQTVLPAAPDRRFAYLCVQLQ